MKKILTSFLISALIALCHVSVGFALEFPVHPKASLTVNGDNVIPKFSKKVKDYYAVSLSTITPNFMKYGDMTKTFEIESITPEAPTIPFKIGEETYHLHIWRPILVEFETTGAENVKDGHYFISFEWLNRNNIYPVYIVDKNGKILYYRSSIAPKGIAKRSASDFKYTILPDKSIVYSLVETGELLIMDENFQTKHRTKLLPHANHKGLQLDGHHHLIFDNNHYLVFAPMTRETLISDAEEPIFVEAPIIQEIKDGQVIFEWDALNYPDLFIPYCSKAKKTGKGSCDATHLNTLLIDPNDNNLILSFRGINTLLKVNRKDGHIMWKLSGPMDEFNLTQTQRFYGQHLPSFNANNELILFDNHSNMLSEKFFKSKPSSVKKFKLDEKNKQVVFFKETPLPFYSYSMGSTYQLQDNRYVISSGSVHALKEENLCAIEVTEDGQELWSLKLKNPQKQKFCYYVYKRE